MYSPEQIANATLEELRSMITDVINDCREARTAAAHWRLQCNMHAMDNQSKIEEIERMNMELFISQRDTQMLVDSKTKDQLLTPALSTTGPLSPGKQRILDLRNTCELQEMEINDLRNRLRDAKTVLVERQDSMTEEIERLSERIRQNRKHVNLFRQLQPSALSPQSSFVTPVRHTYHSRDHSHARNRSGGDQFAALLLADQVLNREAGTSAPSTPLAKHSKPQRIAVPHTPRHAMMPQYGPYFVHPSREAGPARSPPTADPTPIHHRQGRRRQSRDSTISASDMEGSIPSYEDAAEARSRQGARKEVQEQGRQHVREPVTPKMSDRRVAGVETVSQSAKRKMYAESPSNGREKRARMEEGVGLGIHGARISPPEK